MAVRPLALLLSITVLLGFASNAFAQVTYNSVTLSWTAPGDDSLVGNATQYDIRYSTSPITLANFASATVVSGPPSPAAPGTRQTFVVAGLLPSTPYYFAMRTADDVPNWSGLSNVVSKTTLAAPDTIRPASVSTVAVTALTDTTATLSWTAVGDDSLTGTATSYDVRYSASPITPASWSSAIQASGEPAPAAAGTAQGYQVRNLGRQTTYYFAIKVADEASNISALSNVPSATTTDTLPPAAIRDLVASFMWFGWHTDAAVRARGAEVRR